MGRYFNRGVRRGKPSWVNYGIARTEPRLVPAPKGQQPRGRALGHGRRLLLGEGDYQAPIPEPEIALIDVRDYPAGKLFTEEGREGLGEISTTTASLIGYGVLGLLVYGLMKGVRVS